MLPISVSLPALDNAEDTDTETEPEEEPIYDDVKAFIASLDPLKVQELALSTRRGLSPDLPSSVCCTVSSPPHSGAFNVVYMASFSDGLVWAIRIPSYTLGNNFSPSAMRSMHLDIVAQRFIASHTSLPVPLIHDYSLNENNIIQRPYIVMDYLSGTKLSKLWKDEAWNSPEKQQYIFDQLARWMVELSTLEFDQIGRLDVNADGSHTIVAFPDIEVLLLRDKDDPLEPKAVGPFHSGMEFLDTLLRSRVLTDRDPMIYLLHLFSRSLPDVHLDGPPFTLTLPDFDKQNILVASDGTITGLIDWDGVHTMPRQGGAAAYPKWLTVDWDTSEYRWERHPDTVDEVSQYPTPDELRQYRRMYLDAIDRASNGRLTSITRNSHVWRSVFNGVADGIAALGVTNQLSRYVFGSQAWGNRSEVEIEHGPWYGSGWDETVMADVPDELDETFEFAKRSKSSCTAPASPTTDLNAATAPDLDVFEAPDSDASAAPDGVPVGPPQGQLHNLYSWVLDFCVVG